MREKCCLIAALYFCLGSQDFPVQNFESFYRGQLSEYVKKGRSFFVSKCSVDGSIAVMFLPQGKMSGIYREFSKNGIEENGADIVFSGGKALLGDLMIGGIATQITQQKIINSLVKRQFAFISSSRAKSYLSELPMEACKPEQP